MTKKLVLIIVSITILVSLTLGLSLGLTLKLRAPSPEVSSLSDEPDYLVTISWKKIVGAKQYFVEYFYDTLYPDIKYSTSISENQITIKRVRGLLKFRVRALSNREMQNGEYCDWLTYEIPGLKLETLNPFDFINTENGWKINYNFEPVTYIYKGQLRIVEYYEFSDNHNLEPEILTYLEIQGEGENPFYFNFPPGETICRFTPLTYTKYLGEPVYSPLELYELYDEVRSYVEIVHLNAE